jgi:hypothetical protein
VRALRVALTAPRTAAPPAHGQGVRHHDELPAGRRRIRVERIPNELLEGGGVEPLRSPKRILDLRLARNDAVQPHPIGVRRETAEHAVADRLTILRGVEVLEIETLLQKVVLHIQERRVPLWPKSKLPASSMKR